MKRLVLVALLLLTTAACGDDDEPAVAPEAPRPGQEFVVPSTTSSPSPSGSASADALESVLADVDELAPALESYFRTRDYPTDVAGAVAALPKTGRKLSPGNTIGGYRFKADETEFVLCVESASGAWATYDTAPMTTGQSGKTGGCPADLP
jgi:hypothetical protein